MRVQGRDWVLWEDTKESTRPSSWQAGCCAEWRNHALGLPFVWLLHKKHMGSW